MIQRYKPPPETRASMGEAHPMEAQTDSFRTTSCIAQLLKLAVWIHLKHLSNRLIESRTRVSGQPEMDTRYETVLLTKDYGHERAAYFINLRTEGVERKGAIS